MSKSYDLKTLFGDLDNLSGKAQQLLGDDFTTGFHIFGLPKNFEVEDFAQHFSNRVSALDIDFPPTICLQGKCILRNVKKDEKAEDFEIETTLTEIIFQRPVDVDIVSQILMASVEQGLLDKGIPDPEEGYAMEAVDADYEQSLAKLLKRKNGPTSGPQFRGH